MADGRQIRFVLIDKLPSHMRKLRMFRPWIAGKKVLYTDADGSHARMHFDLLVVAVGSIVRRLNPIKAHRFNQPTGRGKHTAAQAYQPAEGCRRDNPDERKRLSDDHRGYGSEHVHAANRRRRRTRRMFQFRYFPLSLFCKSRVESRCGPHTGCC